MSKGSIAVIGGTGAEGSGLAVRWADDGYRVIIGSRSAEKAAAAASELSAFVRRPGGSLEGMSNADAAAAANWVVLSVPYSAQFDTAAQIVAGSQGKILVSVVVPLKPPKVSVVWRPEAGSAAEELTSPWSPPFRTFRPVTSRIWPGRPTVTCSTQAIARKPKLPCSN
jgi:NADPH-dependent F420 reductase